MIIHFATLVGVSSQLMDLRNKISAVKVFVAFVISFQKKKNTPGFWILGMSQHPRDLTDKMKKLWKMVDF